MKMMLQKLESKPYQRKDLNWDELSLVAVNRCYEWPTP